MRGCAGRGPRASPVVQHQMGHTDLPPATGTGEAGPQVWMLRASGPRVQTLAKLVGVPSGQGRSARHAILGRHVDVHHGHRLGLAEALLRPRHLRRCHITRSCLDLVHLGHRLPRGPCGCSPGAADHLLESCDPLPERRRQRSTHQGPDRMQRYGATGDNTRQNEGPVRDDRSGILAARRRGDLGAGEEWCHW